VQHGDQAGESSRMSLVIGCLLEPPFHPGRNALSPLSRSWKTASFAP
jgi:hypothetical protein